MKQAILVVEEIKRFKIAIDKSNSKYLKKDYYKKIKSLKNDLKEYCRYKKLNYYEILKGENYGIGKI